MNGLISIKNKSLNLNKNKGFEKIKNAVKFVYVFILIGMESLGNMSAVTAVLQENLIRKNKYVTEEDLIDAITIARLGPGATTANVVAYLGNKIAGFWGGVIAAICYTIAPLVIILCIYGFFEKILQCSIINSALKGSLIYLSVALAISVVNMGKSILTNKFYVIIFISSLIIASISRISCVWIIIFSVVIRWNKNLF